MSYLTLITVIAICPALYTRLKSNNMKLISSSRKVLNRKRFFARIIDYTLYVFVYGFLAVIAKRIGYDLSISDSPEYLFLPDYLFLIAVLLDTTFISIYGKTLAQWLLGFKLEFESKPTVWKILLSTYSSNLVCLIPLPFVIFIAGTGKHREYFWNRYLGAKIVKPENRR